MAKTKVEMAGLNRAAWERATSVANLMEFMVIKQI